MRQIGNILDTPMARPTVFPSPRSEESSLARLVPGSLLFASEEGGKSHLGVSAEDLPAWAASFCTAFIVGVVLCYAGASVPRLQLLLACLASCCVLTIGRKTLCVLSAADHKRNVLIVGTKAAAQAVSSAI